MRWPSACGAGRVELIDKRGALRPVLGALRRGRLVALLLDQNASRREGVFASFFGRPASTPKSWRFWPCGPGRRWSPCSSTAPISGATRRDPSVSLHRHCADAELAVADLTQRCTSAIEAAIRVAPDQWLWIHNRWRTQPLAPIRTGA